MLEEIHWISISRNALPGVIAEGAIPENGRKVTLPFNETDDVFVGCTLLDGHLVPVVAVLNAPASREVLAWLATYSTASFPLSQSLRSISTNDFDEAMRSRARVGAASNLGYWPSVILGELLGQGEYSPDLEGVALSRANACFTFARARSHIVYDGAPAWSNMCLDRLRALESDGLFVKRSVSVEDLRPIWDWATRESTSESLLIEIARTISAVIDGELSNSIVLDTPLLTSSGLNARSLGAGSMEARVREFQAFLASMRGAVDDTNARSATMLVAAAAVLVGNGTSHISLLEEFGKKFPPVFAWFGFLAALAGPKSWDPAWNRASNSVARLLRGRFDLTDPPAFDLSWSEYDFVRGVPKPRDFLSHIPKLYPRLLSIEVVPGAACQFRIGGEVTNSSLSNAARNEAGREPVSHHPSMLQNLTRSLLEVEHQLAHSRSMVLKAIDQIAAPSQSNLFDSPKKGTRKGKSSKLDD